MYNLSHQVQKALHIADTEEQACIAVFADWKRVQPVLQRLLSTGQYDGKFTVVYRQWESPSGSVIKFVSNDDNNIHQACLGYQFSHVFVREIHKYEHRVHIESRLRSVRAFKEPMGYYDEWGVKRYEPY